MRLTLRAHELVAARLGPGDTAIDATAGNGHDTVFLARTVGAGGRVFAFDLQPQALSATRQRLQQNVPEACDRVRLINASHADMQQHVPEPIAGHVRAVMFNLGYLPGGDKGITTVADVTIQAVRCALDLVATDGLVSILAYRGHAQGQEEMDALLALIDDTRQSVRWQEHGAAPEPAPRLFTGLPRP